MTREQLIEAMKTAFLASKDIRGRDMQFKFVSAELYNGDIHKALAESIDALTAAGMVVVPREPTGEMLEAGRKAWKKPRLHVNYNPADELMTCGVIYRDMTEAANAE